VSECQNETLKCCDVDVDAGLLMLMLVMVHQHHLVLTQGEYTAPSELSYYMYNSGGDFF